MPLRLIKFSILVAMLLAPLSAIAQASPPGIDYTIDLIQHQQQQLIDEELRRQQVRAAMERPAPTPLVEIEAPEPVPPEEVGPCVDIERIKFSGNTKVSNRRIRRMARRYEGRCITVDEINLFLNEVTNLYIRRGYITSRAFMVMPQFYLNEGILDVRIIEGRVHNITGLPLGEQLTAFPRMERTNLNLRDFEQGLDQINRLRSNRATMTIDAEPSSEVASNVNINIERGNRSNWSVFTDNLGSASTGEWRAGARFSFDNPLGLNDQINLMLTNSIPSEFGRRRSTSAMFGYSIPWGYWTFSNNLSYSYFKTSFLLPISGEPFFTLGNTITNTFTANRVLARGQRFKLAMNMGLTYRDAENFTRVLDLEMRNDASSRKLAIANFDLPITLFFGRGMIFAQPSYIQGTRLFGAFDDRGSPFPQSAQYDAFRLFAQSNWRFGPYTWTTTLNGQFTRNEMFSSEAFFIGGEPSVRGFKNQGVQGDSGFSIRNDLAFNLPMLTGIQNRWLGAFTPSVFVDYGRVFSNVSYGDRPGVTKRESQPKSLAGAGARLAFRYGMFEATATHARALHQEEWITERHATYLFAGIRGSF